MQKKKHPVVFTADSNAGAVRSGVVMFVREGSVRVTIELLDVSEF